MHVRLPHAALLLLATAAACDRGLSTAGPEDAALARGGQVRAICEPLGAMPTLECADRLTASLP